MAELFRAAVCWANLAPRSGSEQRGRRPVVVVSHDAFNGSPGWTSVIVVPLTTSRRQVGRGPTVVALEPAETGLDETCFALAHQITTIDRSKLEPPLGRLDQEAMVRLGQAVAIACDLRW